MFALLWKTRTVLRSKERDLSRAVLFFVFVLFNNYDFPCMQSWRPKFMIWRPNFPH